jgi:hypothetical protein
MLSDIGPSLIRSCDATGYRGRVIRALPLLIAVVVLLALGSVAFRWARSAAARLPRRRARPGPGSYDFDARTDQVRRRLKGIAGPEERRDDIVEFLNTHRGVEAYVEPKTVMSPTSVVLVDDVGEWRRFELREDAYLRRLAAERGLPIFDAALTGYPPRMRRRRDGDVG